MTLFVLYDGVEMPEQRTHFGIGDDWKFSRYVLRNQLHLRDNLTIKLCSGVKDASSEHDQTIILRNFSVILHKEKVARKAYGVNSGTAHEGGVTFDILSPPAN